MKQKTPYDLIYGNTIGAEDLYKVHKSDIRDKLKILGDFGILNSLSAMETVKAALDKAKTTIELDRIALTFIDAKLGYRY